MLRRFVSFTAPAYAWLTAEARRLGVSVSELVRRAVDEYRERHARKP